MPELQPVSRLWRRFLHFSVRGLIIAVLVIGGGLGSLVRGAGIHATRWQQSVDTAMSGTMRNPSSTMDGTISRKSTPGRRGGSSISSE